MADQLESGRDDRPDLDAPPEGERAAPAPEPEAPRPTAEAVPDPDAGRDLATALEPGDPAELGQYELLGRLGTGGMGTVYLARGGDRRRVAVKVIRPELAKDDAFIQRFHREVAAAKKVAGFCTARVLGADLDPPQPYLVTEYVEGVRLDRAIERNGALTGSNLDGFAVGVAAALTAIHAANVVHRDLKPSNVVLSLFGPRVIDFGIARALDASTEVTRASLVMGTPGWMAPEQLTGEKPGQASDIFVWGTLVAFAATGRAPFGEGSPTEIALRIVNEEPDMAGFDGPLRATVAKCMGKDPARRPSAKALLMELLGEQLDEPVPSGEAGRAATQVLQRTWVGAEALGAAPVAVRPDQTTEERGRRYPIERPAGNGRVATPAPPIQVVSPLVPVAAPQQWPDPWARQRQAQRSPQPQPQPQQAWPGYPVQQAQPRYQQPPPGWGRPLPPPQPQQLAPPPAARPPYQQQPAGQQHPLLPGQWQPPPAEAGGRRARRGLARALAWIACLGALVAGVALAGTRATEWRLFSVRMLLAYGLLSLAFWLLPAARSSRFRAVLARLTGLLSGLLAVGAFAALVQHRNVHEFGNALVAAFLLVLLGYWMYPKRPAARA